MDGSVVFVRRRQCAPLPNTCSLGTTRVRIRNGISIGSAVFAQLTAQSRYTSQQATRSPPQNCLFPRRPVLPSNTWLLGPTRVLNRNGMSIGSVVYAGLTTVRDRQTDRQTQQPTDRPRYTWWVTIGRIYVRSTAMRPKNKTIHRWLWIENRYCLHITSLYMLVTHMALWIATKKLSRL